MSGSSIARWRRVPRLTSRPARRLRTTAKYLCSRLNFTCSTVIYEFVISQPPSGLVVVEHGSTEDGSHGEHSPHLQVEIGKLEHQLASSDLPRGIDRQEIHRSLKVSEEPKAQALRLKMDELLKLAETTPLLPTRSHAIAEQKYPRVVIDAFFNCMTPEPVDYLALRERAMPLPPKTGKKGPVPHVLLAGPTGAGKSRLMQHLLGTTLWNFPMRGAGRTTVADTETIVEDDVDFAAVLMFYAENEIRETIKENILEACAFAHRNEEDKAKIASKLLVDSDRAVSLQFHPWRMDAKCGSGGGRRVPNSREKRKRRNPIWRRRQAPGLLPGRNWNLLPRADGVDGRACVRGGAARTPARRRTG